MKKFALLLVGSLFLSLPLLANVGDDDKYLTITSVETTDITDLDTAVSESVNPPTPVATPDPIDEANIELDKIIALGDKIWKIIVKNKPVVKQNYQGLSIVPQGVKSWDQLDSWQEPKVKVYNMVYKNAYGMKVVEFNYRLAFSYGGAVNGKGQFLSRIEVEPAVVNVVWGYTFNANGEVVNPLNAGSKEAPVASAEIRMNWGVDTVLKHVEKSTRFYVRGDGLLKDLSDGNMFISNR